MASGSAGVLRAEFVYKADLNGNPLTKGHAKVKAAMLNPAVAAVGINAVVGLAGKATESLIDAAAARLQAQATTLDTTVPLDGFYAKDGRIAVDEGCLVFHNGVDAAGKDASIIGVFQLFCSADNSAFRFTVARWEHSRFLGDPSGRWFQSHDLRDFALKIEFLTPGSAGLGTRSVFVEHVFNAVTKEVLGSLFLVDQKLPWFVVPNKSPGNAADLNQPLNVRVTLVETTKPNQLARWVQELAKEKKADIVGLVKDAVHGAIDPNYAATEGAKRAEASGSAFGAYKTAWDDLAAHKAAKPTEAQPGASDQERARVAAALADWTAKFAVKTQTVQAKLVVARSAFDAANLPWPGDLPAILAA